MGRIQKAVISQLKKIVNSQGNVAAVSREEQQLISRDTCSFIENLKRRRSTIDFTTSLYFQCEIIFGTSKEELQIDFPILMLFQCGISNQSKLHSSFAPCNKL
jgi:hypothetical protein